jgi:hypothetical protein
MTTAPCTELARALIEIAKEQKAIDDADLPRVRRNGATREVRRRADRFVSERDR